MFRSKSKSAYQKLSKQHCKQDVACQHCCSCWEKHNLQYQQRLKNYVDMNQVLKQQNILLKSINQNMKTQMAKKQQKIHEFEDLELLKKKMKESLKKELQNQNKASDLILKEKVKSLKDINSEMQQEIRLFKERIHQLKQQKYKLEQKTNCQEKQLLEITDKYERVSKQLTDSLDQMQKMQLKIIQNSDQLHKKTATINRLEQTLNQSENNYILQKTRAENLNFERRVAHESIKSMTSTVESLQQETEVKISNIQMLETKTSNLSSLIREMDTMLYSHELLQENLKERLLIAEEYAAFKEDKYNVIKHDREVLKYYF